MRVSFSISRRTCSRRPAGRSRWRAAILRRIESLPPWDPPPRAIRCGRSDPLAEPGREDPQLVAILLDGAARDLRPLLAEDLDDPLVGERPLRALRGDQLLDPRLDAARGNVLSVVALQPA